MGNVFAFLRLWWVRAFCESTSIFNFDFYYVYVTMDSESSLLLRCQCESPTLLAHHTTQASLSRGELGHAVHISGPLAQVLIAR
jgi:hypothetical protein